MFVNRGGRKLLYISRRVGGKPSKTYVGTGPVADAQAAALEARKQARRARAEACASWQQKAGELEGPLDQLCANLEQAVAGTLLVSGFHRLGRHAWSKRRVDREVQAQ